MPLTLLVPWALAWGNVSMRILSRQYVRLSIA
ncbi:hypothetical protein CDEF62S_02046 [Castellaniella defragrans]